MHILYKNILIYLYMYAYTYKYSLILSLFNNSCYVCIKITYSKYKNSHVRMRKREGGE